jgi:Bacterial PH domain
VLLVVIPLGVFALFARMFRPLVYRVEGNVLVVPRHFGELRVPLQGVRVAPGDLSRAARLAGTGMPGLWLGMFRDQEGGFHACGNRRTDGLMVHGQRRVYVTPADQRAFVAAVVEGGAKGDGVLISPQTRHGP